MKNNVIKPGLLVILSFFVWQNSAFSQDNPVANFSQIISCDGHTVSFTDVSTDPNGHTINSWLWDFGDGNTSTEQNPIHFYAGNAFYYVHLTVGNDAGGIDTLGQVVGAKEMLPSFSITNVSCTGGTDGQIFTNVIGGNPAYGFLWSTGITTAQVTGVIAGSYTVTITDSQGCSVTSTQTVLEPSPLIITISSSECVGTDSVNGWAFANVTGGSAPYMYSWSDGTQGMNVNWLSSGVYTVTVMDANGCTSAQSVSLNDCNYTLSGYVFIDANENGIFDMGELPVPDILVYSAPGPFYGYTNEDGLYILPLDNGTYTITPLPADWYSVTYPSSGFQSVYITSLTDTMENVNFGIIPDTLCNYLDVSVGTGTVRPCFDRPLNVNYQNLGTLTATDVYVEVEFDANISPVSSMPTWDSIVGNSVFFGIGTLEPFESGIINIIYYTDCDFSIVGQTRCFTANIYPQDMCETESDEWDHSSVSVTGQCENDSIVSFVITNTGDPGDGDMLTASEYRIFENELMVFSNDFQINGGESLTINWPANGTAIRLEADQHPLHPGFSHPNAVVENCGDSLGFSFGLITSFPFDDINPFTSILCRTIVNSYDPNDKHVYPSGITENHYVDNFSRLSYLINFQNTGSDTAFTVVVTDTLPELLDITTVVPGASSHPYTFRIFGEGILEWTFNDINLVDSATNEPGSNGFLTFEVEQIEIPVNMYGAVITNRASIYFDFNQPIITDPAWLTIWELPLIATLVPEKQNSDYQIKVYPNPVYSSATIEVEGVMENGSFELNLFSITGQLILSEKSFGNTINIHRRNIPAGVYIYSISSGREFIGNGKLIVE